MTRVVYLNGEYLPESEARVSAFDRGFLMADGIYEVTSVMQGKLLEFKGHMERLARSLDILRMYNPLDNAGWLELHRKLVQVNHVVDGLVYLQITRGSEGDRNFEFPPAGTAQTVVLFTQSRPSATDSIQAKKGIRVISMPDLRWGRRDIKTVQLLYPSMAKMEAKSRGADDVWFTEQGVVTEGTSNNAFIVKGQTIITRPLSNAILHGTTRASLLRFAEQARFQIEERPFTLEEAQSADEAFFTSSVAYVVPVIEIDGKLIGNGAPGPTTTRLRAIYLEEALKEGQ